jgi:hypothetical protein
MSKSNRSNRYTVFTLNTFALTAIFGVGTLFAAAQSTPAAQPSSQAQPTLNLSVPTTGTSLFSSSNDEQEGTPVVEASLHPTVENFANAMQYGGGQRRRYGKTRYRGANTNADGSSKYIFYGGAGLTQPVGNTFHYLTPSYGIQVGGGRQFNKHFAVPIEFNYDHFGFAGETLQNQNVLFGTTGFGLDGTSHVWSFSVDPTYTLYSGDGLGAYVVGGVGFYHKVAQFTLPTTGEYCDYYGCYEYEANETFPGGQYVSNAPGYSGGLGMTYKYSRFSNVRFYVEARYVFMDNSQRQGITVANENNPNAQYYNFYPANSNRTSYIPIKAGIRF